MRRSIKNLNTFGIEVSANDIFRFDTIEKLKNFFQSFRASSKRGFNNHKESSFVSEDETGNEVLSVGKDNGWYVVGEGSNILFTKDFEGTIISSDMQAIEELESNDLAICRLRVDAGVKWDNFVCYCVEKNIWGVENLSAIPGSVGASPVQNIGAYGVEVADVVISVDYFDTVDLDFKNIKGEDCRFGYRTSIFKEELRGRAIIVAVEFGLKLEGSPKLEYGALKERVEAKGDATLINIRRAVCEIRDEKLPDPKKIGNGGSFFKNPIVNREKYIGLKDVFSDMPSYILENGYKIPAAWLIEQSGWKGRRVGNVGVCATQPLVLVNYGGGSGSDVYALSEEIIESVFDKFGIELEREINIL